VSVSGYLWLKYKTSSLDQDRRLKLREDHYKVDLQGWARYYFYFHKIMGHLLATILIAWLASITK
jgi:hypothetical protein